MASPVNADGSPWPRAADADGVALGRTRRRHQRRYPELVGGDRGRLLVLGSEVGGRWEPEALGVLRSLTATKVREAPVLLRRSAALAWHRRWVCLLSVAAQTALAESLLGPSLTCSEWEVDMPPLGDLLAEYRDVDPPSCSRLPASVWPVL